MGQSASASTEADSSDRLYINVEKEKWPIIYSSDYDISFYKMETLHPFDSTKWRRIFEFLKEAGLFKGSEDTVQPLEANENDLLVVHTKEYLDSLTFSAKVAAVIEVPPVALLPNGMVQRIVLRPFRYQTGGTILAGKLAMERGWAINIGGGFHHCSSQEGGGFCAYADLTLSIQFLFQHMSGISKVMILDLDAHQGNGHERDFMSDDRVFIMDMYNRWIYPNDTRAKAGINVKVELDVHASDQTYLHHLRNKLPNALDHFKPDIVVYNAGTDILEGDPLGILDITEQGVIERDQIVFQEVKTRNIPIFMVTSGGYQRSNAQVIANSIQNLYARHLITSPDPTSNDIDEQEEIDPLSSDSTTKNKEDSDQIVEEDNIEDSNKQDNSCDNND